jgi:hypothetical protein
MAPSQTRRLYAGVKATKQGTQLVYEDVVKKERLRSIDEAAFDGMEEAAMKEELKNQDMAHIRQLGEDGVDAFINGGTSEDGANIRGLSQRLSTISGNSLNNVASCGHASAEYNSRIYIVEWNPDGDIGCFGLIPSAWMNSGTLGVKSVNYGKQKVTDPNDAEASYMAHEARHYLYTGLAIGDNLKIACIANINTDEDGANNFISGNGARKLVKLLNNGHFDRSRTRIYVNSDIKTQLDILGTDKSNLYLTVETVFGKPVKAFQEIPIRVIDNAVLNSSQAVVV